MVVITCGICTDAFLPSSSINCCPCGHVYHVECLLQWFERSKSCPDCREPAAEENVTRIYLNIQLSEDGLDRVPLLQKNEALNMELLRKAKKKLEREIEDLKNAIHKLLTVKEKNSFLELKSEINACEREIDNMLKKMSKKEISLL